MLIRPALARSIMYAPDGDGGGDTGGDGSGGGGAGFTPASGQFDGDGDSGDGDGGDKPPPDPAAEISKWKALARKHEDNAKKNADAAERLRVLEDSGKTETEKLQALVAQAQKNERDATVRALKLQVAADKGLPAALAKFLPDLDDEVDMLAAADELLEASGSAATGGQQPTRQSPKSRLTNPLGDAGSANGDAVLQSMLGKSVT